MPQNPKSPLHTKGTTEMILSEIKQCGADSDEIRKKLDNISIDDFLKALIADSDLDEVIAVLDTFNANNVGKQICVIENGKQVYPVDIIHTTCGKTVENCECKDAGVSAID